MNKLENLIRENENSYFKMLSLIGNEKLEKERIIKIEDYLTKNNWKIYDVEEVIMKIIEEQGIEDIEFKLGYEIKNWISVAGDKIFLKNANILYSKELSSPQPFHTFKYLTRSDREVILILDARMSGTNKAVYSTPDKDDYATIDISEVIYEELTNIDI